MAKHSIREMIGRWIAGEVFSNNHTNLSSTGDLLWSGKEMIGYTLDDKKLIRSKFPRPLTKLQLKHVRIAREVLKAPNA